MHSSPTRPFLLRHWGLLLGLLLIAAGLLGGYYQQRAKSPSARSQTATGLRCKISAPALPPPAGSNPSAAPTPHAAEPTLLTGATLILSGPPKASVDDTVVVRLCVESKPELPQQRREALIEHLLVQLSAVGLQVEPHQKIPAAASSPQCLGTAEWTVRATAPGHYTAVLVPESTDQQPKRSAATPSKLIWDFDLEQPAQLNIQFQTAWSDSMQKIWAPVSAMLGIVLVITQIMLNLQQRKKSQVA